MNHRREMPHVVTVTWHPNGTAVTQVFGTFHSTAARDIWLNAHQHVGTFGTDASFELGQLSPPPPVRSAQARHIKESLCQSD